MDNEEIQTNAQNNNKDSKENRYNQSPLSLCFYYVNNRCFNYRYLPCFRRYGHCCRRNFLKAKIFLFPI